MVAFNKINDWVEELCQKEHDIFGTGAGADDIYVALARATDPPVATDTALADITQPTGTGYTAGGIDTLNNGTRSGATFTLVGTKAVWTAGAGDWLSFQYVMLYNNTHASDSLIGWWDYGSPLTLLNGETFSVKFSGSDTSGDILTIS